MTTSFWLPSQSFVNSSMYQNNLRILFKLLILISYIPHIPFCLILLKQPERKHWAGSLQQRNFSPSLDANLTKFSPSVFSPGATCGQVELPKLPSFFSFFFPPQVISWDKELLVLFYSQGNISLDVKPSQQGLFASWGLPAYKGRQGEPRAVVRGLRRIWGWQGP